MSKEKTRNYSAKVVESSRELTAKERISLKDTSDAVKIDVATADTAILIYPELWAEIEVHNEKSDDKDYRQYVVVDRDGTKYVTGSQSFWTSFTDIADEMMGLDEKWGVKVYKLPSKNFVGRDFITCSIV